MGLNTSMDFHAIEAVRIAGVKRVYSTREYTTMTIIITDKDGNDTEISLYSADTNMRLLLGDKE
jgi:hypothetical protein